MAPIRRRKRTKSRNSVAYCTLHKRDLTTADVAKKQCGLERTENGERKYTGKYCPYLKPTNEDWWRGYEVKRARRLCGKQIKKMLRKEEDKND